MRRIERLINLVAALLETNRPLSADEIRQRIAGYEQDSFEAFRRAFERDKEALREMGIPLELRRSDPYVDGGDGYIIPKERYYLPELDLAPDELAALRIAAETVLGPAEAGTGMLKLSLGDDPAWRGPQVIAGANVAVEDPRLNSLYTALLDRRRVQFSYTDAHGRATTRRVEPWRLVHRTGHWYLIGRDAEIGERRTFKLSRIDGEVRAVEGSYEVEEPADEADHLGGEAWEIGSGETTRAWVRFGREARWWAEQNLDDLPRRDAVDGALDVEMRVSNEEALLAWVVGWGGHVAVVAPDWLQKRLVEHLEPWLGAS
jgi:proteasome accessory factor B